MFSALLKKWEKQELKEKHCNPFAFLFVNIFFSYALLPPPSKKVWKQNFYRTVFPRPTPTSPKPAHWLGMDVRSCQLTWVSWPP